MRFFMLAAALSTLMLAGCSDADWNHAMTYTGVEQPQVAAADPAPPPAQAPAAAMSDTGFCQAVAKQDATGNGFDPATEQRVFQHSFQQCVAMFGTAGTVATASR